MTIGQQQVLESLYAGLTVCARDAEGEKCLVRKNFEGEGFTIAYITEKDEGFWDGSLMRRFPDMKDWEIYTVEEDITSYQGWEFIKVYNPIIIIDPPKSEQRY